MLFVLLNAAFMLWDSPHDLPPLLSTELSVSPERTNKERPAPRPPRPRNQLRFHSPLNKNREGTGGRWEGGMGTPFLFFIFIFFTVKTAQHTLDFMKQSALMKGTWLWQECAHSSPWWYSHYNKLSIALRAHFRMRYRCRRATWIKKVTVFQHSSGTCAQAPTVCPSVTEVRKCCQAWFKLGLNMCVF